MRKTFLIDEFGKIVKIYDQVSVLDHGNDILRDFNRLKN
jgi:peroxiredoxin